MKRIVLLIACIILQTIIHAQTIQQLTNKEKISLRGLSVVDDKIIWASGSDGQVAKSVDGGKTFQWLTVKNYEKRDFRDIAAFDANIAVIMAVDTPAVILKTIDGGKTWKEVYRNNKQGMFLDAMDFDNKGNGIVVGDPLEHKLFIATSNHYGDRWLPLKQKDNFYLADSAEAFFAASGTNVKLAGNKYYPLVCFVTGGSDSRLFLNSQPVPLNIIKGKGSQGANSIALDSVLSKMIVVGGDFTDPTSTQKNIVVFNIRNNKILAAPVKTQPHGYRSCVAFITTDSVICCGTTGVDISNDGGLNWRLISNESFNVCAKAKNGSAVFLAGKDGIIAMLKNVKD